jgi:hypothetical protein
MSCRISWGINRGTEQHSGVANQMSKEQKARLSPLRLVLNFTLCKEVQRLSEAVQSQISGIMLLLHTVSPIAFSGKCNLNFIQNY